MSDLEAVAPHDGLEVAFQSEPRTHRLVSGDGLLSEEESSGLKILVDPIISSELG